MSTLTEPAMSGDLSMPAMATEESVAPVVISDYSAGLMPAVRRGHISIQSLFRRRNYGMLSLSTTNPPPTFHINHPVTLDIDEIFLRLSLN